MSTKRRRTNHRNRDVRVVARGVRRDDPDFSRIIRAALAEHAAMLQDGAIQPKRKVENNGKS